MPLLSIDSIDNFLGVGVCEYVLDFVDVAASQHEYLWLMAAVKRAKSAAI